MNRELKRKGIISIAVHAAVIIFLILRSFIACHHVDPKNISPFLDLRMGADASAMKGGAELTVSPDDAFPVHVRQKVATSKKLIKHPTTTTPLKKPLSEGEIKRILAAGITADRNTVPGTGPGGAGSSGTIDPYAWYLGLVRAAMYEAWQQPSSLVGKQGLVTSVQIRVLRDGQITSKKVARPSGNAQMDDSVLRALGSVDRLPALPPGFGGFSKDIIVDFELTEPTAPAGG